MTEIERLRAELAATQAALACAATGAHTWHDFASGVAAKDIAEIAGADAELPGFAAAVAAVCQRAAAASTIVTRQKDALHLAAADREAARRG